MQGQLVCSGCRTVLLYPRGAANVCCSLCKAVTSVPPPGMEMAQLICGGCRTLLMHARGATSVRCSCCHTVNLVPGTDIGFYLYNIMLKCIKYYTKFPFQNGEDVFSVEGCIWFLASYQCIMDKSGLYNILLKSMDRASFLLSSAHQLTFLNDGCTAPNHVSHVSCGNCRTTLMYPAGAPSVKCAICHYITNVNAYNTISDTRVPAPVHGPGGNPPSASTPSTSTATANLHNQTVVVQNPMSVDESGKLVSNVVVGVTT